MTPRRRADATPASAEPGFDLAERFVASPLLTIAR